MSQHKACEDCNDTGMKIERREGTDYWYTCKECNRYDPALFYGYELRQKAERENLDVPRVVVN